ncbi:hypothetical protein N7478_008382 [Penicillium angulare]|uniref:uncharacterized protein n=1 Tax=Penicillium angulare TaxID=116970 RepID=UPI00253F7C67|nr:uncharacterized protein N7478_008382 [Penicillium angulare]KAJ5273257.1 hypothetical protein N7478_008382 [Penicillium angulare]
MPICIECSYPVSHLYSAYSRADDRSQGKGVRLTQCPRCQRFADKYVEYDFVVIFIDLVLIKPQRSIIRLGVLLLLFDVYLTWARLEKDPSLETTFISRTPIVVQYLFFLTLNALATLAHHLTVRLLASILVPKSRRYGSSEITNTSTNSNANTSAADTTTSLHSAPLTPTIKPSLSSQTLSTQHQPQPQALKPTNLSQTKLSPNPASASDTHLPQDPPPAPIQTLHSIPITHSTSLPPQRPPPPRRASTAPIQNIQPLPPPTAASPTAISTALLVSSCAKLFPILLVIWGVDGSGSYTNKNSQAANINVHSTVRQGSNTQPTSMLNAKAAISSSSSSDGKYPGSLSSSLVESWLAAAESSLRPYLPTRYLTGLFDILASLLSFGVVDTHLVLLSNIEALYILLGCGYLRAVAVAVAGQVARWAVQKVILGAVGVG